MKKELFRYEVHVEVLNLYLNVYEGTWLNMFFVYVFDMNLFT